MTISGDTVDEVESYKNLYQKNSGFDECVKHKIKNQINEVKRNVGCFI